jgi:hypothetical protein
MKVSMGGEAAWRCLSHWHFDFQRPALAFPQRAVPVKRPGVVLMTDNAFEPPQNENLTPPATRINPELGCFVVLLLLAAIVDVIAVIVSVL